MQDKTFKQKSKWTEINEKPFHTAFLREITDLYESGDISYGRMVEMLNEIAIKWHNQVDISKMETTVSKMERVDSPTQTAVQWLLEIFWGNEGMLTTKQLEQAKQMEKEQIQKAFSDGQEIPINHPTLPMYSREEYYNDTYLKGQDNSDTGDIKI